jgi:hypothetical protein
MLNRDKYFGLKNAGELKKSQINLRP